MLEARLDRRWHMTEEICWFEDISLADVALVGGKGANLGELTAAKLPVPPGFVVTSQAYLAALDASGARTKLQDLLASGVDADDSASLAAAAATAHQLIVDTPLPADLADDIRAAYRKLGESCRVAVRSSGTSEDAGDTSFAGMNATFTNIAGEDDLLARIVDCWASLYGERVIAYRSRLSI